MISSLRARYRDPTIYAYADTNPQYAGLLKVGCEIGDARPAIISP